MTNSADVQESGDKHPESSRSERWTFWLPLLIIVAIGFFLRLANLKEVQPFDGDQGRDYIEVYKWLRLGNWPLLGPGRVVGDFAIGPGWFYVLAPIMYLTGMSVTAGAATITTFAMAGAALAALVVRRLSASSTAGLIAAAAWCFAPNWVTLDRFLWNPHLLPFITVALLALLAFADEHPLRCLVGFILLGSIGPQLHTTAYLPLAAATPLLVGLLWTRRRMIFRAAPWKLGVAALIVAVWVGLLYLPPLWHELTGTFHNMVPYFKNTFKSTPPFEAPMGERVGYAYNMLTKSVLVHNFGDVALSTGCRIFLVVVLAAMLTVAIIREPRRAGMLPGIYILLLTVLYFYLLQKRGTWMNAYYIVPVFPLPTIVICWGAGRLLSATGGGFKLWRDWVIGAAALAMLAGWSLYRLPAAMEIRKGGVWYGKALAYNTVVAKGIAADAKGRPFSMVLVEEGNFNAHFHWLLIDADARPMNWQNYNGTSVERDVFGELCFVVVRGALRNAPVEAINLAEPLPEGTTDDIITVYRVPVSAIPPDRDWLLVYPKDGKVIFECVK